MGRVTPEIPPEADWEQAPGLLEGVTNLEMTPSDWGVERWLTGVAQGSLVGLVRGRRPESEAPDFLREPGPLRDSLIAEFGFRSEAEVAATKACALITSAAPDAATLEFYATQTIDEARHAYTFREHLLDLGVPREELRETIETRVGADRDRVLDPLWAWGLPAFEGNFVNGVVIVTVLLEGVLAPTTELSERKWKPLSPATADIERGACVDEIRHLTVGSRVVRDHLLAHPEDRDRIVELIVEGRRLWSELPTAEIIVQREMLYEEGFREHADVIGDYEIFPGRRLVDTTAEERLQMALQWSRETQESRMRYMGLEEAIPEA